MFAQIQLAVTALTAIKAIFGKEGSALSRISSALDAQKAVASLFKSAPKPLQTRITSLATEAEATLKTYHEAPDYAPKLYPQMINDAVLGLSDLMVGNLAPAQIAAILWARVAEKPHYTTSVKTNMRATFLFVTEDVLTKLLADETVLTALTPAYRKEVLTRLNALEEGLNNTRIRPLHIIASQLEIRDYTRLDATELLSRILKLLALNYKVAKALEDMAEHTDGPAKSGLKRAQAALLDLNLKQAQADLSALSLEGLRDPGSVSALTTELKSAETLL